MKGILEFDLPQDQSEFKKASEAMKLWCAICDFDRELRNMIKYGEYKDITTCLNTVRENWNNAMDGIDLSE